MGKLANNLKRLRAERQMTQEELAKRVGVSQPAIARFEAGMAVPKLYVTIKLADALGVKIDDLVSSKEG